MKLLAIDSSSLAASAAVLEDGRLIGESFVNIPSTHSQTLLPMVQDLMKNIQIPLPGIDLFAVTIGPGSFTGLRIGIAAAKGLAYGQSRPCVGISTLEALAQNLANCEGLICPVMDARCSQVYNALFEARGGELTRLCADRALSIDQLSAELKSHTDSVEQPIFLVGDGAELCYNRFGTANSFIRMPSAALIHQRASSVGVLGYRAFLRGEIIPAGELVPAYLRLPQAERELLKKQQGR